MAIHFNSQKERFAYLRGEYHEITPVLASETASEMEKSGILNAENAEKCAKSEIKRKKSSTKPKNANETVKNENPEAKSEKKSRKKASKSKKKEKKDDEVQAE